MPVKIQELLVRVNIASKKEQKPSFARDYSLNISSCGSSVSDFEKKILENLRTQFSDRNER